MSKKTKPAEAPEASQVAEAEAPPQWSPEDLVAVAHLGPGIIGRAMYEASQAYVASSAHGILGPATRG